MRDHLKSPARAGGDQSHRSAKAIAAIKVNYARPLRVEELAGLAGHARLNAEPSLSGTDCNESTPVAADTRVRANSTANPAAFLVNNQRVIFGPFGLQALRS
jgi:hypothetical protein